MMDRFGDFIRVGFSPVETEWMRAAVTLPLREREQAYIQIAAMTGRKLGNVRSAARQLLAEHRTQVRAFLEVELRKHWQTGCAPKRVYQLAGE